MMQTEPFLLVRAKEGDALAFKAIVQIHEHQIRKTVIGMLGDTPEADDVAQEVFIRFFRAIKDFKEEAKLSTYLTRIAINLSLNELKRRKKRQRRFGFFGGDKRINVIDGSSDPERIELKELIDKGLAQLDPDFRAVIVLRLIEGYSVKETAELLDLPKGTVASRLARAQVKLKEIIQPWMDK